jgi:hypothetical protein
LALLFFSKQTNLFADVELGSVLSCRFRARLSRSLFQEMIAQVKAFIIQVWLLLKKR